METPIEITLGDNATTAVIWLHGLGADGSDFVPIIPELGLAPDAGIRFIFPHAPLRAVTCNGGYVMRAWYDVYSLSQLDREDAAGLVEARAMIEQLIAREAQRGIPAARIVLLGFSQGGAVALHAGLRHAQRLAGIGALSTYLPLHKTLAEEASATNARTPIFMAHGRYDAVVSYTLGERSRDVLKSMDYAVAWHAYPMEHSICPDEIDDLALWLRERLGV